MAKKALLVNPWVTDFKLYDEWMHPIGLYILLSLLKKNGWEAEYLNFLTPENQLPAKRYGTAPFSSVQLPKPPIYSNIPRNYKVYGAPPARLHPIIQNIPVPDVILVTSAMTYWLPGLKDTVQWLRQEFSGVPIVIGGISARLIPDILRTQIPGAAIFDGAVLEETGPLHIPQVGLLSRNGWEFSLSDVLPHLKPQRHAPVVTSWGCPLRCSYCASSVLSPGWRDRSGTVIIAEIETMIRRFDARDFAFYDDALLYGCRERLHPLLRHIIQQVPNVRFHTPNGLHLKLIEPETLDLMRRAGFVTLRFGYESGLHRFGRETSQKAGHDLAEQKIRHVLAAGFSKKDIGVYVMAGLPDQGVDDVLVELTFIASLGVQAKPVFISPVPQTPLFEHYARQIPELRTDPLSHNDFYFITRLPGWGWEETEIVRKKAREINER